MVDTTLISISAVVGIDDVDGTILILGVFEGAIVGDKEGSFEGNDEEGTFVGGAGEGTSVSSLGHIKLHFSSTSSGVLVSNKSM